MAAGSPGTLAGKVMVGLGLLALGLVVWTGRNVLFVFFFGVLVSTTLSVFADLLVTRRVPRPLAVVLVFLSSAGLVTGLTALVWPTLREQFVLLGAEIPELLGEGARRVMSQYQTLAGMPPEGDELVEQFMSWTMSQASNVVSGAIPIINTAFGAVAGFLLGFALGFYLAVNPLLYHEGLVRLVPPAQRHRVRRAMDRAGHSLRRWLVGTIINMVIIGFLTSLGLWLIGVPAAAALGLLAGMLEFVPIFGPLAAAVPGIAIALTISPLTALWATLFYIGIQQFESNVLTPLVMRGAVRLPPALTIAFQSLMAVIFGLIGLLLAVPILAAGMKLVQTLYIEPMESPPEGR